MPSKKELAAMQKLIDDFSKNAPKDSNTKAQSEADSFMSAMSMADDETKRRNKIRKAITGR